MARLSQKPNYKDTLKMLLKKKKSQKTVKTAISMIAAVLLCFSAEAQDAWQKERSISKREVTRDNLHWNIGFLSDTLCHGRGTGTVGNVEAAFWLERAFKEMGLMKFSDSYSMRVSVKPGIVGRNIIGMIPGAISVPRDRYVIVGAHYDHIGILGGNTYPGADSNASGTIAMLSIADMFSSMKEMGKVYDSNIIFVAFDAKEAGMAGSQELWNMISSGRLKDPVSGNVITPSKISLMVNIDQIGSSLSPLRDGRDDYLIMLGTHSLKYNKRKLLEECNRKTGIGLDIALDYYGSPNFTQLFYRLSDQKVFVDNRIPSVLFTSGITMNNNKTWDNVESLNFHVLQKRIYLIYSWIEQML